MAKLRTTQFKSNEFVLIQTAVLGRLIEEQNRLKKHKEYLETQNVKTDGLKIMIENDIKDWENLYSKIKNSTKLTRSFWEDENK